MEAIKQVAKSEILCFKHYCAQFSHLKSDTMIVDESSVCIDWATFNKSLVISIIGLMALYEPIRIYPIAYKHYTSEKIVLFQATISRERERERKKQSKKPFVKLFVMLLQRCVYTNSQWFTNNSILLWTVLYFYRVD